MRLVKKDRIDKIEKSLTDLTKKVDKIAEILTSRHSAPTRVPPIFGTEIEGINPWVAQTSEALNATLKRVNQEVQDSLMTYKRTIKALIKENKPLSADEVSEITKRQRNTESAYLKKLYVSGFVRRTRDEKQIKYSIADKNQILRVFNLKI